MLNLLPCTRTRALGVRISRLALPLQHTTNSSEGVDAHPELGRGMTRASSVTATQHQKYTSNPRDDRSSGTCDSFYTAI